MIPTELTAAAEDREEAATTVTEILDNLQRIACGAISDLSTPDPSANGQIATARMHLGLAVEALANTAMHLAPAEATAEGVKTDG